VFSDRQKVVATVVVIGLVGVLLPVACAVLAGVLRRRSGLPTGAARRPRAEARRSRYCSLSRSSVGGVASGAMCALTGDAPDRVAAMANETSAQPLRSSPAERRSLTLKAVAALDRLADARAGRPVHTPADAALLDLARRPPPTGATDASDILDRFVDLAGAGWDKSADGVFAYVPNGALDSGVVAALLAAGAHAFTGTSFEAPALVAMEEGVLRWIADVLGLPATAGGLLLSGGSLANQTAIVAARARALGLPGTTELTMYASELVHHSVTKAAALAGIPRAAMRMVPTDEGGRISAEALETLLAADVTAGRRPFLVVGVAGATDTGSIDPLERLAEIAARAGAWFHVDAAYGGFFALTERGRARLRGIERADSVTVDAHKGLFLPYGVAAILVREPGDLVAAHEGAGGYFRALPTTGDLPHYCQRGPELTRPARGLLLWFPLHLHGTAAFTSELDRMLDLAASAHARLTALPGVVAGPPPELSIVTFRAVEGDEATDAVVAALHATGRFQVSTTTLDGQACIRFAFLSPRTTWERVAEAIDVVAQVTGGWRG
jgi:aromatic-L-amino-acid decarboxylase